MVDVIAAIIRAAAGVEHRWVECAPLDDAGQPIQRIYYANHASHLDSPLLWASLPAAARARTRPVAAADYWSRGIRRLVSGGMNAVFVERCGVAAEACAPLEEALAAGDSLIFFPEGTRNVDPSRGLAPFKAGLYHLAVAFPTVEIVPVALDDVGRMMPKGVLLPIPILTGVTFGEPVPLLPDDDRDTFLDRARTALAALMRRDGEQP
jgi:1-acyl-sn-glycerol-3-phosphate acyltransferase